MKQPVKNIGINLIFQGKQNRYIKIFEEGLLKRNTIEIMYTPKSCMVLTSYHLMISYTISISLIYKNKKFIFHKNINQKKYNNLLLGKAMLIIKKPSSEDNRQQYYFDTSAPLDQVNVTMKNIVIESQGPPKKVITSPKAPVFD